MSTITPESLSLIGDGRIGAAAIIIFLNFLLYNFSAFLHCKALVALMRFRQLSDFFELCLNFLIQKIELRIVNPLNIFHFSSHFRFDREMLAFPSRDLNVEKWSEKVENGWINYYQYFCLFVIIEWSLQESEECYWWSVNNLNLMEIDLLDNLTWVSTRQHKNDNCSRLTSRSFSNN